MGCRVVRLVRYRAGLADNRCRLVGRSGARHRARSSGKFSPARSSDICRSSPAANEPHAHPHLAAVAANRDAVRDRGHGDADRLSHIGLNIAPLLAGAGVVGLAIGFGSQALVKDIITGLFILIEDQIAVGDIIDVGKDHRGMVEAISIRTIRLRDQAGIVHTVPFSEVTSIKNLSKEFAYAVARIAISYSEDIDRVVEILRGVGDQLKADETVAPFILDPLDYQGVDGLEDTGVVLLMRIRTVPGSNASSGAPLIGWSRSPSTSTDRLARPDPDCNRKGPRPSRPTGPGSGRENPRRRLRPSLFSRIPRVPASRAPRHRCKRAPPRPHDG